MSSPRFYLILVAVALIASGVAQSLLPSLLSSDSIWAFAPGWQREIAIWNICLIVIIVGTLWYDEARNTRMVIAGIITLTFLLGINHLVTFAWEHPPFWHTVFHWGMFVLNALGTIMGGYAFERSYHE